MKQTIEIEVKVTTTETLDNFLKEVQKLGSTLELTYCYTKDGIYRHYLVKSIYALDFYNLGLIVQKFNNQ